MEEQNNLMMMVLEEPKPLSAVKTADILRVAKRLIRRKGIITVKDVYDACRTRIPGSIDRYTASLQKLARPSNAFR